MQHSQREFFYAVLSNSGLPCLATITPGIPGAKHQVFNNLEEFCNALSKADYTKADHYFAVSTLAEASIKGKDGKSRVRTKENAYRTRCFILDVDPKEGKEGYYATKEEGLQGIADVQAALNLPQPIIVDSGNGYHVYWPMAEGVDSEEWAKVARKFKTAIELIAPGCVADASRVSDQAGILRIPDSFNLKNGQRKPVSIIQWHDGVIDFDAIKRVLRVDSSDAPNTKKVNIQIAQIESPPADLTKVAKSCNWVAQYLANRKNASEPEWYAMLGLAPYLTYQTKERGEVSGIEVAHLLSKAHPEYSEAKTESKYAQAKIAQSGPTTCGKFESIEGKRCAGCPFRNTVKTPIQTARLEKPRTEAEEITTVVYDDSGNKAVETVTIPLPPAPYYRGDESGGVFLRVKVKDEETGEWVEQIDKIYDYDLYPIKRFRTEAIENEVMEVHVWLPKDGLRKFKIPTMQLADNKKLAQTLAEKGVISEYGKGAKVAKFLTDYIRHLQMTQAAEIEFSRFGWRDALSAEPKFVVGDGYIDKHGVTHPAAFTSFLRDAAPAAMVKGDLEKWKQGFMLYDGIPDSEAYILASMLGFAAPLMALTEYSGVLVNLVGHSAAGKSTALKVMSSVWGQPNPQHVLVTDTPLSIFNFIGYLNSVPVAFDEVTKMDEDKISDFVLNFTSGRGKMRASREGNNKTNEVEWDTIICATSNTSIYDKLANARRGYNAEAMRVFELNVAPSLQEYKPKVDAGTRLLSDNYGLAGREFIKYVIPRAIKIREMLDAAIARIAEKGEMRNEERFWVVMMACVLIGGKIAKNLGLHTYDIDYIVGNMLGDRSVAIRQMVVTTSSDPVSVLSEYFNTNLSAIFKVDNERPSLSGDQGRLQAIKIRMEYKDGQPDLAYLSIGAIREYCKRGNIDPSWLRRELLDLRIILRENLPKRLATGSALTNTSVKCWEIDLKNPKLLETLQEIENVTPESAGSTDATNG